MSKQRNQVNVRLDDKSNDIVNKIAKENRVSKSEVVRLALAGELAKMDARKNKTLSNEDRETMLRNMGTMMSNLSKMQNHNARLGSNINQMAKALNRGEQSVSSYQLQTYVNFKHSLDKHMVAMAKELDRIWHTLV